MDGSDLIEVRGLRLRSHIGVTADERLQEQPLVVSIAARVDTRAASAVDELGATLDYQEVVREIAKLVSSEEFGLVETVADRIARQILEHPQVDEVWVRVSKPEAPLPEKFDEVAVEITRTREDFGLR